MVSSMNWVDGPGGGTPMSAANLDKLAVVADVATAGTPTGDALGAAYVAHGDLVFNVRDYGAKGDGSTNDTAAIQAALTAAAAAPTNTMKRIYFPPGVYIVSTVSSASGLNWCLSMTADNVQLMGAGPSSIIRNTTANAYTILFGGCGKPAGHAHWLQYVPWRYSGDTFASGTAISPASSRVLLPISPAARGANSVTCTTHADAGTLSVGDYVVVRAGQTVADAGNWNAEPDSEYNVVKSVNSSTGVVAFERPLAKDYAQEWQTAVGQPSTTTSSTVALPLAIAKITEAVQKNVAIESLRFESTATTPAVAIRGIVDGFRERDLQFDCNTSAHDLMEYRNGLFENIVAVMRGTARTDMWPVTIATGVTDVVIENLTGIATDVSAVLHLHEGSARIRARRVTLMSGPSATINNEISIRARAYDVEVDDYYISGYGTSNAVFIGADCTGGGRVGRGVIRKSGMAGRAVLCQAKNWLVEMPSDGLGGDIQIDPGVGSPGVPYPVKILSGWVSHSQTTVTLGPLPADSVILSGGIYVYEVFNSDGTDQISLGTSGSPGSFAAGIDVSTAFNKTVPVNAAMGFRDVAATLQASYAAGGSAPTTGRAMVWLLLATAPAQPVS